MKNKENRFEWKDYDDRSTLYCGDRYIATVDYKENTNYQLSLRVEQTVYSGQNLLAANLDDAKEKAVEIVAFEYEKVVARAKAKLEEYKALAGGLTDLQYVALKNKQALEYNSPYGSTERVVPKLNSYADNDNLYLGLDYLDEEFQDWLPYTDVTVNVGKLPYLESALDTNNNSTAIITFLEKNGFGHLTGQSIQSGYCAFPVFKFNEDKLREVDPENFALYAKTYGRDVRSLDDTIKEAKQQSVSNNISTKEEKARDSKEI